MHCNQVPIPKPVEKSSPQVERRFNVVLYGISECPSDSPRPERMKHDLDTAVVTLNKLNNEINHSSIRDGFKLGRFKQNQARPRPLLIKLNRAIDVITILANRGSLDDRSKPDMSPQERQKEALLLKHRWSLMQSGISKTDIKIKSSSIYVKGKKYGYILNSEFQLTENSPPIASSSQTSNN